MSLSDILIQRKIQGGDIVEFERLFVKYYEPLVRHADKILNDLDTAEDTVQEFFYNFWKNRESFTPKLSLNAYLYRSITNNALRHREHMAIRRTYTEHVLSGVSETEFADVPENVEMSDLKKAINATLQQMPERCSQVFRMNRFEGKKYREIAEILSISVKTVEADMGKALQMFRKSLEEYSREGLRISSDSK